METSKCSKSLQNLLLFSLAKFCRTSQFLTLQALLWTLPATLLFLSATASRVVMTPDGNHERENSDVRNNLVEPYEGISAVTSRILHEPYTPRPRQDLAQRENSPSPFKKPQARTLSIPSFLGGEKETEYNQAATTPTIGEIAPLNDHPLWKVHKYQGIDLSPVLLPTAYGPPSESYGPPAETYSPPAKIYGPPAWTFGPPAQKYGTPAETHGPPVETYGPPAQKYGPTQPSHPSETYSPPTDTYGPTESSVSATPDTTAALSALDNLSGLVSLLPEEGQKNSPSLSALNSLATLLPQKSNSGLSLEQLSALASLVTLLQAKSNGAPASTYGPPNTRGTDISSLVSLVKVLPSETASSSGSLLARLQSLLRRRPSFLHKLLNALNLAIPSENKGVFLGFVNPSKNHPLKKASSTFDSELNSVAKFTKHIPESKVIPTEKFKKHVVLGKLVPKIGKLGKLPAIKSHIPINSVTAEKGSTLSKLGKLGKLGIIKGKLPLKFGIVDKSGILKFSPSLGKHFPLKVHLSKIKGLHISPLGKKHLPLKAAILAKPLKVKKHIFSKVGKLGKIIKPAKLGILGKLAALKNHLLSKLAKLVKIGVNKSHIPFKLLGKYAAKKKHLVSKLIKLSADAKHIKHGIIFAPIVAKKHVISKLTTLAEGAKNIKSSLSSKPDILTDLKIPPIPKFKTGSKLNFIKHPTLKLGVVKKPAGIKEIIGLKAAKLGFPPFMKFDSSSIAGISRKGSLIEKGEIFGKNGDYILKDTPNFFLGTNPDADVANLLHLPDLPPVTIPANYKFQETGVGNPYIVKYSKPVPSPLPDSAYEPPQQNPVPTYGASAQLQEEGSLYPPLLVSSRYGTPHQAPTSFGPQQETSSFQPTQPNSQQGFTSYQTPTVSYPTSVQEPGSFINSYGQPVAQYGILPAETDHKNSNFQTQSQNPSYNNAAQTSPTDTSAIQSAYSVLQQNQNQPQVEGPSVDISTHQFAQSGPYLEQSYPPSRSDLFHGTSRSDTNIPSEDLPSKQDDDFRPSTLAAATGSGYSRVAFQRSQHQDAGLANQPEGEQDFVTTPTSDMPQLNSDLQDADASMSHVPSATSVEDSELLKESVFRSDSKKFLAGNR